MRSDMWSVRSKFQFSSLILSLLIFVLFGAGCGKNNPGPATGGGGSGGGGSTTTTVTPDPAQYGTPYANIPVTENIVMYEVNIKTFTPANFQGVEARLDSIKALGVNVLWLMPTYPIGTDSKSEGSPYCVKDNEGVNADFGTLSDLRTLVAQAHTLGMAVILDWEANDTSWDNAWITANPSWYVQNSAGQIQQLSTYTDVAALNFNNASMRTAMIKAMKYWIFTANVDGYRCDDADNAPTDFWLQALDTLNKIKTHKLIYLAEGTNGNEIGAGFQLGYAFSYYSSLKTLFAGAAPSTLFGTNSSELASLPTPGLKLRYITNHDDASSDGSTLTIYNGKQGALAAFVLAAYMDGVPLIYSSQEVGYPGAINFFNVVPVNYSANPDIVAAYKQIIAFRASHEAIKSGTLTTYADNNIVAFEKTSGTDDVLILVNSKNSVETYSVPSNLQGAFWKNGFTSASVTLSSSVTLQPYQYMVLSRN